MTQDESQSEAPAMSKTVEGTIFFSRVLMGLYFMLAGVGKAMGEINNGIGSFYQNAYKPMQPFFVPDFVGVPMGYTLPWIEIVLGALMIVGLLTRLSTALVALLIVSFTMALIMAKGGIAAGSPGPFHPNFIMIGVCLIVIAAGGGRLSLDALACQSERESEASI